MIDGFLAPAALWLSLLGVPIIAAYMLKTRRPRRVVSSTFLWREATKNVTASRPWQRLKPSVLLLLQLLALLALVLMAARPFRNTPGVGAGHLVLIVDASGSMRATDEGYPRIEAARLEAEDLLETLAPDAVASVISAGPRPRVMVSTTSDRAAARRALANIQPTEGPATLSEAFLLAESLERPEAPATIVLLSDGGLTAEEKRLVPPGTVFRGVGRRASNVAISALHVSESAGGFDAFVEIRNFDRRQRSVELAVEVDETPIVSTSVTIQAGRSVERKFDLGDRTGRLTARIDPQDDLASDDRSFAVLERLRPKKILLGTPGNLFLEALLRQVPGAEVEVTASPGNGAGYDLAVYDRVEVPSEVLVPALFIAATSASDEMETRGVVETPSIGYLSANDPLLEHVDLSDLAIAEAVDAHIPGARTIVGTTPGSGGEVVPLIAVWEKGTLRRGWLAFDLHSSNLPLQVAFPILSDHLLGWLTGAEFSVARFAGDVISPVSPPGTEEVRVRAPGGRTATLAPGEPFSETERAGFYSVQFLADDQIQSERTIALSFPPRESDLLPSAVQAEGLDARPGIVSATPRALGPSLIVPIILLLLLEWWWSFGRPRPVTGSIIARDERKRAA